MHLLLLTPRSMPHNEAWRTRRCKAYSAECVEGKFSEVGLPFYGVLRRVMHNCSDQKVGQVAQRSSELVVEPLPAGVGCHLGRQAGQKTTQRLCPVPLQGEEVLELIYDPFDDLPLSRRPASVGFRPRPLGVVFGSGHYQRPIEIRPASFPLHTRKALVGQVGLVRVLDDEKVSYGAVVGGCLRQPEGADHALWADRKCYLEPVNPLGLGGAPPEGGLPGKQSLARSSHPHNGRNESSVQDMVDLRNTTERSGHCTLEVAQIGLQRAHPPVELALGTEVREVEAQMCVSKAPEISLASEAGPLGEDRQGDDLGVGKQGWTASSRRLRRALELPPVVYEDVQ